MSVGRSRAEMTTIITESILAKVDEQLLCTGFYLSLPVRIEASVREVKRMKVYHAIHGIF